MGQAEDADELVDGAGDAARVGSAIGDGRGQGGVDAVAVDQRFQLVLRAALQAVGGGDVEVDAQPAVGDGVEDERPGQAVEVDDGRDGLEDVSPVGGDGLMMLGGDDGEEVDVAEGVGGALPKLPERKRPRKRWSGSRRAVTAAMRSAGPYPVLLGRDRRVKIISCERGRG